MNFFYSHPSQFSPSVSFFTLPLSLSVRSFPLHEEKDDTAVILLMITERKRFPAALLVSPRRVHAEVSRSLRLGGSLSLAPSSARFRSSRLSPSVFGRAHRVSTCFSRYLALSFFLPSFSLIPPSFYFTSFLFCLAFFPLYPFFFHKQTCALRIHAYIHTLLIYARMDFRGLIQPIKWAV